MGNADEEAGEVPKAFVVLKPVGTAPTTTADALITWGAERVAPHKRIREVHGKILRRLLMQR